MTCPLYIFAIADLSLVAPCKYITHGFVSIYCFHLEKKVRYEVLQVENVKLNPRFVKGKAFNLHSQTTRDAWYIYHRIQIFLSSLVSPITKTSVTAQSLLCECISLMDKLTRCFSLYYVFLSSFFIIYEKFLKFRRKCIFNINNLTFYKK